ncbi:WRKY transcription factor [Actinidia chinensis var. chinensis]|uniref:WRKY transcription factor n=1 Tax=Actinidia chinensis var. chinensis TaxID=1590841 RepID=A0A2R6RFL2_ACTCC|nr:WRKY transcription factor [Actinidia chinensis var. chinensis]
MDNFSADWEQKSLINELTQGMELAKQLQIHLNVTSSSHETRELLVHKILNSYDKALSMLKFRAPAAEPHPELSPRSLTGSPNSEDSDFDFKDHEHVNASRKRKSVPRWTKQVQVCPGTGLEGPLDDGFSWRKYGQKDILGAKFPRGYYRCTHRNVQGCLATKQVQRSDEDPTIFEITYRGRHTCTESSRPTPSEPNAALGNQPQQINQHPPQNHQNPQETLLSFQTGLKVLTKDLNTENQPVSSFYFPSTSLFKAENYVPSHTMTGNNLMTTTNFSPSFMSPGTSGSNYFSVSPTNMTSFDSNQALPAPESELGGIVPASAASATTSPTLGLDFPFGGLDDQFEPTFTFDNSRFF